MRMNVKDNQFNNIKEKAVAFFKKNKKIKSPSFWEIKITPEWFNHIEWKNKNHKRPLKESYIRYKCFLHLDYILSNSKLYQEFREYMQEFEIKRKWKKKREKKLVSLYGFVAVVNNNKNRIKIVVRKVDWWDKYEFVSVIPVWKGSWYSKEIYFDNEESFLESLSFKETKKLS